MKTSPYPGFATDLQQPITPLLLKAEGTGTIVDTIYENVLVMCRSLQILEQNLYS